MDLLYPMTGWPILVIKGMFLFLIVGPAYGSAVTANLPAPTAQEPTQSDIV